MPNDPAPGSLAQLLQQRSRLAGAPRRTEVSFDEAWRPPEAKRSAGWKDDTPKADALGQFGFSFEDARPVAASPESQVAEPRAERAADAALPLAGVPKATSPAKSSLPDQVDSDVPAVRQALPAKQRDGAPWTVGALVSTLRGQLESNGILWVEGELSNCRPAQSGHLYFTLKDGEAQLGGVLFRRQAALLKWRPSDGMAVLVRGRLSVFEGRGQLQMIAESLEPRGAGALQLQFEQLKQRLRDEGLFDAERKRALPAFPKRIGVVTSRQGAVIRDIVTVCRRRHGCMSILLYPAAVQGAGAAAEIAAGVRYFNRMAKEAAAGTHLGRGERGEGGTHDFVAFAQTETHVRESGRGAHGEAGRAGAPDLQAVDLIVVARGGGSVEDLQAFNDEALARTIAASELPVVSAVGHETDFTIADFVADLRAPTPSAAAELITASQHRVEERVQALHARLYRGMRFQQVTARQRYAQMAAEGVLRRMRDGIDRRQQRVDSLRERLERVAAELQRRGADRVRGLETRLQRQDVRQQLRQAHAVLLGRKERLLRAGEALTRRHRPPAERTAERLMQTGAAMTARPRQRAERAAMRLMQMGAAVPVKPRHRLERAGARLEALSPLRVLERGYALAFAEDGSLVRSAAQLSEGAVMTTRFADGAAVSRVSEVRGGSG